MLVVAVRIVRHIYADVGAAFQAAVVRVDNRVQIISTATLHGRPVMIQLYVAGNGLPILGRRVPRDVHLAGKVKPRIYIIERNAAAYFCGAVVDDRAAGHVHAIACAAGEVHAAAIDRAAAADRSAGHVEFPTLVTHAAAGAAIRRTLVDGTGFERERAAVQIHAAAVTFRDRGAVADDAAIDFEGTGIDIHTAAVTLLYGRILQDRALAKRDLRVCVIDIQIARFALGGDAVL